MKTSVQSTQSLDIQAKLLANEDIKIQRKRVRTASFDVKNRILTIPQRKDLAPEVEEMLICHEVGHALFTDYDILQELFSDESTMKYHSYFNVVEDPREEKLVKRKYPGTRRVFYVGYKMLHDMDFFSVNSPNSVPVDERCLGDRINLFYKGMSDSIVFANPVEADLARRVGEVETMYEAFDLAVEIYKYDEANHNDMHEDDDHDFGDGNMDDLEQDEDGESQQSSSKQKSKDKAKSEKQESSSKEKGEDGESDESDEGAEGSDESSDGESSEHGEDKKENASKSESGKKPSSEGDSGDKEKGEYEDDEESEDSDGSSDTSSDGDYDNDGEKDSSGKFDCNAKNPTTPFDGKIQSQQDLETKIDSYSDTQFNYADLNFTNKNGFCPIVDYKTVIKETEYADTAKPASRYRYSNCDYEGMKTDEDFEKYFAEFKAESKGLISYLKKEFDLKKSAEMFKRTTVTKTGNLDVRKLYGYKINDDMFRRITTIREAKNHGMVFLLDWSSSMFSVMQKTIEQVCVLASFCKACNIPFRVFAFSSTARQEHYFGKDSKHQLAYNNPSDELDTADGRSYSLLEFFNSAMTTEEFNKMSYRLLRTTIWDSSFTTQEARNMSYNYDLRSTPFNSSLVYMNYFLPKFKAKMNLEKITLVTLTDGASHTVFESNYNSYGNKYTFVSPSKKRYELIDADGRTLAQSNLNQATIETRALVNMIKDTGVTVVGLNITSNTWKSVRSAVCLSLCSTYKTTDQLVKSVKSEDSYVLKDSFYNLCVVFPRMLKDDADVDYTDDIGNKGAKGIAREFIKINKDKKKKRAFLDAFISTIA